MVNKNPQNIILKKPLQELSKGLYNLICRIGVQVVMLMWQNNLDLGVGLVNIILKGTNTWMKNNKSNYPLSSGFSSICTYVKFILWSSETDVCWVFFFKSEGIKSTKFKLG